MVKFSTASGSSFKFGFGFVKSKKIPKIKNSYYERFQKSYKQYKKNFLPKRF